jgi:hypothetical protein
MGRVAVAGTTNGVTADAAFRIGFGALFTLVAGNVLQPWIFTLFF